MGTKKETLDFLTEISELEDRFERIGKEIIPELESYNVADEISYDAWNYGNTLLKYEESHKTIVYLTELGDNETPTELFSLYRLLN